MIYHWKLVETLRADRQDLVSRQLPYTWPQPHIHTSTSVCVSVYVYVIMAEQMLASIAVKVLNYTKVSESFEPSKTHTNTQITVERTCDHVDCMWNEESLENVTAKKFTHIHTHTLIQTHYYVLTQPIRKYFQLNVE